MLTQTHLQQLQLLWQQGEQFDASHSERREKRLNITPAELAEQLQGLQLPDLATNVEMLGNPNSDLSLLKPLNEMAQFLKAQGKIDTIPDMAKHLDPTFVKAALAKLG